ncbi:hypothetical protein PgNI_11359 [Pyricularia grisea]|uniref:Secreted protein n=1 Tax=Pyricularia grisea TaxID=148305 RepID=A0A6P8APA6_PYRGI|nr:hypothetical protein PgNI_11359 [Pyricularia grisea]TLD03861.1 hypothetical protein PgNI_11359 [Pyricularia grisea]
MRFLYFLTLLCVFEGVLSGSTRPAPRRSSRLNANQGTRKSSATQASSGTNKLASSGVLPKYRSNAGVKKSGGQYGREIAPPRRQTSPGGTERVIETYDGNKIPGHTQAKYDAINQIPELAVNKVGSGGHRDAAIGDLPKKKNMNVDETPRNKLEPTKLPSGMSRQDATFRNYLPASEGKSEGGISTQTSVNSKNIQKEKGSKPEVIVNPINVPNPWADKKGGPSGGSSSSSSRRIKRRSIVAPGYQPDVAVAMA